MKSTRLATGLFGVGRSKIECSKIECSKILPDLQTGSVVLIMVVKKRCANWQRNGELMSNFFE
jgi:hypothetical protein